MKVAKQNVDILGVVASLTCALHCLAVPLLIVWLGTEANHTSHHVFDLIMICVGVYLATVSLLPTIKSTKNAVLTLLLALGVCAFGSSFFFDHSVSHFLFATGGISWAAAHAFKIFYLDRIAR